MGDKVMMVATAELTQGAASPGARGTALCGWDKRQQGSGIPKAKCIKKQRN